MPNQELENSLARGFVESLQELIADQPWFERFSNTTTSVITGLVTFTGWMAASGFDLPLPAQILIGGLLFVAGVLGIKSTRNGVTESLIPKLTSPGLIGHVTQRIEETTSDVKQNVNDVINVYTESVSEGLSASRQQFEDAVRETGEGLSASVRSDIETAVADLASQIRDATRATARTDFVTLPNGERARIQLSVTPQR